MTIYLIAYSLMIIIALICNCFVSIKTRKYVFCCASFTIWVLVLGLRHPSMGVDLDYGGSNGYLGMYQYIGTQSLSDIFCKDFANYEKGYVLFNKLLSFFNKDPQFLLIICAIICMGSVSWIIYKYSEYPLLSYIIYLGLTCFLINFSGLRQALAISITLFSYKFIREKKIILFVIFVLLAATVHYSAIMFLVAYPCYRLRTEKTIYKITSIAIIILVFIFKYQLFSVLSKIFREDAIPDNNSSITMFFVFVMIYIFSLLFEHKMSKNEIGLRNIFYLSCLCQAFSGIYSLAMRLGYFFMIYLILLLPEIIGDNLIVHKTRIMNKNMKNMTIYKQSLLLYFVIFISFAVFGVTLLSSTSSFAHTNPYHFFWSSSNDFLLYNILI